MDKLSIFRKVSQFLASKLTSKEIVFVSIAFTLSLTGILFALKSYLSDKYLSNHVISTGIVREGMIATVKSIDLNYPTLQIEKDFAKLVLANFTDLTQNIITSPDGLTVTAILPNNLKFHDNSPIKADDIMYSFGEYSTKNKALDKVSMEKIDDLSIAFKLEKANAKFSTQLNFPIIKKDSQLILDNNLIGSGPFKVKDVRVDNFGDIETVYLESNADYYPKTSFLQKYQISIFHKEEDAVKALSSGKIDLLSGVKNKLLAGNSLKDSSTAVSTSSMSSNFVLFVNQSENQALQKNSFRKLISNTINRNDIVNRVFGGYADALTQINSNSPIELNREDLNKDRLVFADNIWSMSTESASSSNKISKAINIKLSTVDTPELIETAEIIKEQLKNSGINTEVEVVAKQNLEQILRDKKFDLFLFGFYIPDASTYYNFFHSSQTSYPKLNISGYANKKIDDIVTRLRSNEATDEEEKDLLNRLSTELGKDMPVIFLYKSQFAMAHHQNYIYKLSDKIASPEDRYQFVTDWYTKTEKVFPYFKDNKFIKFLETF